MVEAIKWLGQFDCPQKDDRIFMLIFQHILLKNLAVTRELNFLTDEKLLPQLPQLVSQQA